MRPVPFRDWLPDRAALGNPGVLVAKNVLPTASGYAPVPGPVVVSGALDARPRGAIAAKDNDGVTHQYAGDAAKLYERSGQSWGDVSKSGGYSTGTDERWEFVRWKNKILATNFSDSPQQITFGATNFSDLTTALRGRHIAVVRDQVVLGSTFDSTDGEVTNRVRWSALDDETDWTVSASTLSDFQDLPTGGAVRRVLGGEFGIVVSERSIWRMQFVGSPFAYQFDEVLTNIGTVAPGSVVMDGNNVYLIADRGIFQIINGTQPRPIGAEKVDRFVLQDFEFLLAHRVSAIADTVSHRIMWSYPGPGNVGGRPNRIIIYDTVLDRWSFIELEHELIFNAAGVGTTLEELDNFSSSIDALETSLDSSLWKGGIPLIGVFDESFQLNSLTGNAMDAVVTTGEAELTSGRQTRLSAFRPIVNGTVTAEVGTRNNQSDNVTFGNVLSPTSSGRMTTRANARYIRFRFNLSDWTEALGYQIDEAQAGERRGL